jgi:hypothetical protein
MEGNLQGPDKTSTTEESAGSHFAPASHSAIAEMCSLLKENRAGKRRGIYSVCSANRLVLEAAFAQAKQDQSPLLIEATSNQVAIPARPRHSSGTMYTPLPSKAILPRRG